MKQRYFSVFIFVTLSFCLAILAGSSFFSCKQLWHDNYAQFHLIYFDLRLTRALTAFTSGGLLSLAGCLMQLLLANPLADPYVLGISSGAALAALSFIFFGFSEQYLLIGAWGGSLLTIFFIMALAKKHCFHPHSLLLLGIAIACGFSACINLLLIMSADTNLHNMLFWLTGDLNTINFPSIGICILVLSLSLCLLFARGFNILARGEQEALALGLNTSYYRMIIYLMASLCTATAVTLAGCIGFVGLIIPHTTRKLLGYDHRILIPFSVLMGGGLVMLADTLARTLIAPSQLPVGIILAFIGVPSFIWLMKHA